MAWWAPWTWFRGNKEEEFVEGEEGVARGAEEQAGLPPELPEEEVVSWSWWRPWTWFRGKGAEEFEVGLPPAGKEELPAGEEVGAYRPAVKAPELERERPSKGVLVEEEEVEVFPPEEEEYPGGLYISGRKIQGGFKKFCLALFSIFLLPFILVFGVCLATCAFLLVFPMLMAFFPVFLIGFFMFLIVIPVAVPVLMVYTMVTERVMFLINSKGYLFSLKSPPAVKRRMPEE